jgi:hypothetical protein
MFNVSLKINIRVSSFFWAGPVGLGAGFFVTKQTNRPQHKVALLGDHDLAATRYTSSRGATEGERRPKLCPTRGSSSVSFILVGSDHHLSLSGL